MNFKNLTFENLKREALTFSINKENSYLVAYPEFIKYFKRTNSIEKHHLIIGSHFVYGWMPTIIDLNISKLKDILNLLNEVKKGKILNAQELEILKKCINNSMVGVSKLLHFINPENYAIWDSRILKFCTGQSSQYGIEKPQNYLVYIDKLNEFIVHPNYDQFHALVEEKLGYKVTPMRALEITMFQSRNI
jgi:hypothetical protein